MRLSIFVLLVISASVACGRTRCEDDQVADKQSTTPERRAQAAGQAAKPADAEAAHADQDKVVRTEKEWRKLLTREQYRVLRMKGTERPFTNKYDRHFEPGTYACAACGQELFASDTKFNSGCGWPAFYAAKAGDRVALTPERSLGMVRTEVTCARCGSHLGHIFDDAPQTPTGQRFCINSVSLKFIPAESKEPAREERARDQSQPDKDKAKNQDKGTDEKTTRGESRGES